MNNINVNPSTRLRQVQHSGSGHRAVGSGVPRAQFTKPLWGHPDLAERIVSAIPKGRIAEPEEIVGAVLFLAFEGVIGLVYSKILTIKGG